MCVVEFMILDRIIKEAICKHPENNAVISRFMAFYNSITFQVYWESLGCTYWVHWHMIEIVGSSRNAEQKAQEKVSTLRELLRQNTGKILLGF